MQAIMRRPCPHKVRGSDDDIYARDPVRGLVDASETSGLASLQEHNGEFIIRDSSNKDSSPRLFVQI